MPFLFIFVLFGTQTFSSCLVKLLYSCLSGCVICFALLYVSYVLLHRNQFFVCVCESVCASSSVATDACECHSVPVGFI